MRVRYQVLFILFAALLGGCVSSLDQVTKTGQSAVQMRSYQERVFDTADKPQTLRSVIATLQDLNFVLDKADLDLGMVTATKLSGYELRVTVTVRPSAPLLVPEMVSADSSSAL